MNEVNPFFRKYYVLTNDLIDETKPQIVSVFRATGNRPEKGRKIFEYNYEPLLEPKIYLSLLEEYGNSPLLQHVYSLMCFNYSTLYSESINWYIEKKFSKAGFNLDKECELFDAMIISDYCCPIVKVIDSSKLANTNFYKNLNSIINYAEVHQIDSVSIVLYGKAKPWIKDPYTSIADIMVNSVMNIVYESFSKFLKEEKNKEKKANRGTDKNLPNDFKAKSFKDLFINPKIIPKCINLLRETDIPCIDQEGNFARHKGVFVLWLTLIEDKKLLHERFKNDKQRAETLNHNFNGLDVSEGLFRQDNRRAKDYYYKLFETEISVIKNIK